MDCGYHREGVDPECESSISLVKRLAQSDFFQFSGLYAHAGHSYDAKGVDSVRKISEKERDVTVGFAKKLRAAGEEKVLCS